MRITNIFFILITFTENLIWHTPWNINNKECYVEPYNETNLCDNVYILTKKISI